MKKLPPKLYTWLYWIILILAIGLIISLPIFFFEVVSNSDLPNWVKWLLLKH